MNNIQKAAHYFSNTHNCYRLMLRLRGGVCPYCGSDRLADLTITNFLRCKDCRVQFSLKQNTLFEDSPLMLGQWFLCLYALYKDPAITCQRIMRIVGVTLRTAWVMRCKLQAALSMIDTDHNYICQLKQIILLPKEAVYKQLRAKKAQKP